MNNNIEEKWNEILERVRDDHNLTNLSYNTWIQPLKLYRVDGQDITILVPTEKIGLDYVSKNYSLAIKVAICEVTGMEDCTIHFVLPDDTNTVERQMKIRSQAVQAGLNPKYTFDTFVVGSNNKFAHAASVAVAESPGQVYNPLFLYGGVGLGKTHLMNSIAHYIIENHPEMNILYVTSEEFTNEVIEAIRNGKNTALPTFREKYRNIDVLLIDDIQFIIGKESTQEEFFHTFNALATAGNQIVLTSDMPPKMIETLDDRLRNRFEWGLIADIQPPDLETRMAIIKRKAVKLGLDIPDDVIQYIAQRLKDNIRQLEGAVKKMQAYVTMQGLPVSITTAQAAIKDIMVDTQPQPITVDKIVQEVARTYGVSADDIRSKRQDAGTVEMRQMSIYLVRELTGMSTNAIGKAFGGKNHTTVLYSISQFEDKLKSRSDLREKVESIKKNVSDKH